MLCRATKKNGSPCGQTELLGNGYCQYHQHSKYHQDLITEQPQATAASRQGLTRDPAIPQATATLQQPVDIVQPSPHFSDSVSIPDSQTTATTLERGHYQNLYHQEEIRKREIKIGELYRKQELLTEQLSSKDSEIRALSLRVESLTVELSRTQNELEQKTTQVDQTTDEYKRLQRANDRLQRQFDLYQSMPITKFVVITLIINFFLRFMRTSIIPSID